MSFKLNLMTDYLEEGIPMRTVFIKHSIGEHFSTYYILGEYLDSMFRVNCEVYLEGSYISLL